MAVLDFVVWYYPLGLYQNALVTDQLHSRHGLTILLIWSSVLFCSTFSYMVMTIMHNSATAVNVPVIYAETGIVSFDAPSTETCGDYLASQPASKAGRLLNPDSTTLCQVCTVANTDGLWTTLHMEFFG
ncbi:hypothetical protein GJ744_007838 [Endocarpon pusillum]|uniref:Uncharacterized protein n=1 Tax=Endocarpon pusillum TaxID=364733 RepID=A0A8H7AVP2_9EURO|nr:hypothetical protein GJ744_007838 [Endocarpon pusillum]